MEGNMISRLERRTRKLMPERRQEKSEEPLRIEEIWW